MTTRIFSSIRAFYLNLNTSLNEDSVWYYPTAKAPTIQQQEEEAQLDPHDPRYYYPFHPFYPVM